MSSRELILGRVRAALRDGPAPGPAPRDYRRSFPSADLDVLVDRLVDYKATVRRITEDAVAAVAAEIAGGTIVVPEGLPSDWRPSDVLVDEGDPGLAPDRIAGAAAVLTAAAVAVAETGTIVLDASPDQGRRIITLLPDVHIVVLRPGQVVASVPEAVARLDPARPLTWISGPSATSDIELNRVEGVHGPRNLHILLLES